jgi:hypothetical protein
MIAAVRKRQAVSNFYDGFLQQYTGGLEPQAERSSAPYACDPKLDIKKIDNQL